MLKNICIISIITLILGACELNQSVHKDFITGAYSKGDGIVCNNVKTAINGKVENRNSFVYGEKVSFIFNEIHGLTKIDGKVYPELSMCVVKNEQDTVSYDANLLGDVEDGTDLSALQLEANFVAALPFKNNEKYKVYLTISDKKGDGRFTYELPFSITENKVLQINSSDLTYSFILLWDITEKRAVTNQSVNANNTFALVLDGVDGLKVVDGKVYPVLSVNIIDNMGNQIISIPNALDDYQSSGIEHDFLKNEQPGAVINFSLKQINNPYKLKASLTDLNSHRRIDIKGDLELE